MKTISIINLSDYYINSEGIYNIKDYESFDLLINNLESKYILFTSNIQNLNLNKIYKLESFEEDKDADIVLFLDQLDFLPNKVDVNFIQENFLESLFINFENILFNRNFLVNKKLNKEDLSNFFSFNSKIYEEKLDLVLKEDYICRNKNNFNYLISDIFNLKKIYNKQKYLYIYGIINSLIKSNLDKNTINKIVEILNDEFNNIDFENYKTFLRRILNNEQFNLINTINLIIKYGDCSQIIYINQQIKLEIERTKELNRINLELNKLDFIKKANILNIYIIYDKVLGYFKQFFSYVQYILSKPFFIGKDLWLIGERRDQAEDNAFRFFKYVRENYPDEKIYYIIDKSSIQYQNVYSLGNVIEADSIKHKIYLMHATKLISAYDFFKFLLPSDNDFKSYNMKYMKSTRIFLQHGVSLNKANYYNKYINKYDYILASTNKELNMFIKEYNYDEDKIIKIGLPRYDMLKDLSKDNVRKKILFMPTWRSELVSLSEEEFKNTDYYNSINDLINDNELNRFIEENNLEFIVYLHYEMQIFNKCFEVDRKNISFKSRNDSIVQQLLMEANLLITDYSSVGVDFAYLDKPVIFYQFSKHNFHYDINREEDYTLYSDFGKVVSKKEEVLDSIVQWKNNNYNNFYTINDNLFFYKNSSENCEKIYEFIKKIPKKKKENYIIEITKENNQKEKRVYDNNYNFIKREFYNGKLKVSELIYKNGFINKQILYNLEKKSKEKVLKKVKFYKNVKISNRYNDIYDKKGNLIIKHNVTKNGILKNKITYYPNTNKIKSIITYNLENQKVSCIEKFYNNGNLQSKLLYNEKGIAENYMYYSDEGSILREYDYYSSGKVKCKKFYSDNGKYIINIKYLSEINEKIIYEEVFNNKGEIIDKIKYFDF